MLRGVKRLDRLHIWMKITFYFFLKTITIAKCSEVYFSVYVFKYTQCKVNQVMSSFLLICPFCGPLSVQK